MRFGDEAIENEIREYLEHINDANTQQHYEEVYINAKKRMKEASSGAQYLVAADEFDSILGFADSEQLSIECREKAKNIFEKYERCKKLFGDELLIQDKLFDIIMELRKDESDYYNMIFQHSAKGKALKDKIEHEQNEVSRLKNERKAIVREITENNHNLDIKDQIANASEGSIVIWGKYQNCYLAWRVLEKKDRFCVLISDNALCRLKRDLLKGWNKDFLASRPYSNAISLPRYDEDTLKEIVERLKIGICTPLDSDEDVLWTFDSEGVKEFAFTNRGCMYSYYGYEVWVRPAIKINIDAL